MIRQRMSRKTRNGLVALTAIACLVATLIAAATALALTITNEDETTRTLMIEEERETRMVTLAPRQSVSDVCKTGCLITLEDGAEAEFDGHEIVLLDAEGFVVEE